MNSEQPKNSLYTTDRPVYQDLIQRLADIYYTHYPDVDRYRINPLNIAETGVRSWLSGDKKGIQPYFANSNMIEIIDRLADIYRDKPKFGSLNALYDDIFTREQYR